MLKPRVFRSCRGKVEGRKGGKVEQFTEDDLSRAHSLTGLLVS